MGFKWGDWQFHSSYGRAGVFQAQRSRNELVGGKGGGVWADPIAKGQVRAYSPGSCVCELLYPAMLDYSVLFLSRKK